MLAPGRFAQDDLTSSDSEQRPSDEAEPPDSLRTTEAKSVAPRTKPTTELHTLN